MKYSVIFTICFVFTVFAIDMSECKKYGKSSSKKSSGSIMKQVTKPRNIIAAAAGGYVAHKVLKKVIKKPKLKFGVGGFGSMMAGDYMMMRMVSRDGWGYHHSQNHYYFNKPASRIFVHHTASADCYNMTACMIELQRLQSRRLETEGQADIGYNFMIGGDGHIYEGLGWFAYGHYRPVLGEDAIAVAFMGDFSMFRPNDAQLEAFRRLIRYGDDRDFLKSYRIHGHRDIACTSCPGDALYALVRAMPRYRTLPPVICSNYNLSPMEHI